jgi:hypothetical protein
MSMADETIKRSLQSDDPPRRSGGASAPSEQGSGGDPLAELARLIGQSDPFADFGQRNPPRSSERVATAASSAGSDWRKTAAAMPAYDTEHDQHGPVPDAHLTPANSGYPRHDPYQPASDQEPMADPGAEAPALGRSPQDQRFREADRPDPRRDDAIHAGAAPDRPASEPYFDDGAPVTPNDEQSYDDVPRARRRSGLVTAVALIACAMVGTAGAYGYRTYYTGTTSAKVPPVIPAEVTPNKIVPASDGQTSKAIQDRVGDLGPTERMMPGAEQPVDLTSQGASTSPRVVLPPPVQPLPNRTSAPGQGSGPAQGIASGTSTPGGEPKRVRTVTIRPDGTDVSGRPGGGVAQSGGQATGNAPPVRTTLPSRSAPPAARNNGGPISLDPQAPAYAAPPTQSAPVRERTAAAIPLTPPAPRAPAGPAVAAAPPAASVATGGGGYLVQLSSQRSEGEAQSSFRSLQARFPNQLGGRAALVKRADLGAKGTFYRAMVGPFASSGEADQFCGSLKAAGGQCIIQRN